MSTATFPTLLQRFFTERLCTQMEASPNTIAGYRDTFRLLLRFASQLRSKTRQIADRGSGCRACSGFSCPCRDGPPQQRPQPEYASRGYPILLPVRGDE